MSLSSFIEDLKTNSYYSVHWMSKKPIIIFEDHRFLVPVLWLAKQHQIITAPIKMFRFDAHLDDCPIKADCDVESFYQIKNFNDIFDFVDKKLAQNDDDWLDFIIKAGMIDGVITIGGERGNHHPSNDRAYCINSLEGALNFKGKFSDLCRSEEYERIWKVIGWKWIKPKFEMTKDSILFDIDCDYFSFNWRGNYYAWLDRFYEKEFSVAQSSYYSTEGWSMLQFTAQILNRAPFVTISLEHGCCGGKPEVQDILKNLNGSLFENSIDIKQIYSEGVE